MWRSNSFAIIPALAMAVLVGACGGGASNASGQREFTLQGQVLALTADRKEANIKNEDIKGFMPAMTMPYKVRDAKEFEAVAPGDLITATLVVASNDAYLKGVKKVGQAPLEQAPPDAPMPAPGAGLVKEGQPVPNTSFVDQDGKARTIGSFKGSAVVLTFIYTRCPMPTFCPLMDRNFAALQTKLKTDPLNVHLVSVSFDPDTDTPPVLKKHAKELDANPKVWTFLTGDRDAIDAFARGFGVSVTRERDEKNEINITHTLRTAIIDREGNLVKAYTGNEWTPDQVIADIKVLVGVD